MRFFCGARCEVFLSGHATRFAVGHAASIAVAQGRRRGPRMDSLKNPRRTSCWSSIVSVALNRLVFGKMRFIYCEARGEACCRSKVILGVQESVL